MRAQLKKGASQIKLALGGGVISDSDPIDTLQYTSEEIRAAVQVATDWGTYVAAHVYTNEGIRRALDAGVMSIEHGHLANEATLKMMAAKGTWLSTQPFEAGDNPLTPEQVEKARPTARWEELVREAKRQGGKASRSPLAPIFFFSRTAQAWKVRCLPALPRCSATLARCASPRRPIADCLR